MGRPRLSGGDNIALKVPKFRFDETLRFYRDVLGLPVRKRDGNSWAFEFGPVTLWIDMVEQASQSDIWLELFTSDADAASDWLEAQGTPVRDELEPLDGLRGHWISDPAGVVHLLYEQSLESGEDPPAA
jgi:catechol 2,3-dioxygenase-like lactoylglutathione lyase family enzyme